MKQRLFALSELADPGCRAFEWSLPGEPIEGFVVRYQGRLYGYRNHCPHTGVSLNWRPDQFLDVEQRHIQCAMHGALFRIETGVCIWGPCLGESLSPLPVRVEGDDVVSDITTDETDALSG